MYDRCLPTVTENVTSDTLAYINASPINSNLHFFYLDLDLKSIIMHL